MYRRFFYLGPWADRVGFRSQPVSFHRINSIAILAAAQIPVRREFLVETALRLGEIGFQISATAH